MAVALEHPRTVSKSKSAVKSTGKSKAEQSPQAQPRPNLVVVQQQRRRVSRSALVIVSLLTMMFAVVSLRIYMAQEQVKLDQLNQDVTKARQYFDQLRAERSSLQSPSVLMEQARTIGMEPAVKTKIVAVSPEVAAVVAATVGKIDDDFLGPSESPLVQFGEVKSQVGRTP